MFLDLPAWLTVVLSLLAFYALVFAGGALLLRRSQSGGEPVDVPETSVEDFFADVEELFEPHPEELPDDEAEETHDRFGDIVAGLPDVDRRMARIVATAKAIPGPRRNEGNRDV